MEIVKYICPLHGNNETKAYTLFLGHGCPICAYEQNGIAARKSPNEVYDLFFQNGSILLNKYTPKLSFKAPIEKKSFSRVIIS